MVDDGDDVIAALREQGWCQGAVVHAERLRELFDAGLSCLHDGLDPSALDRGVVISQDCDIVHRQLEREPEVELLLGVCSESSADGNLTHGKNPRRLQLQTGEGTVLELTIRDRVWVPKRALAARAPDEVLERALVDVLIQWIARRYRREAFPDAFNERLKDVRSKLIKLSSKSCAVPVTALYVEIDPFEELTGDEPYEVSVLVIYRRMSRREDVERYTARLEKLLDGCDGIDLSVRCEHHSRISLKDLERMRRWSDFDYRSFQGEDAAHELMSDDVA